MRVSALNHIRLAVHHHNGHHQPEITLQKEEHAAVLSTAHRRERFTLNGLTARGRGGTFDLTDRRHRVQLLATVLPTQATTEDLGGVTPLLTARGFTVTVGRRTPWTSAFHLRPVHARHPDGRVLWLAEHEHEGPGQRLFVTLHAGHATLAAFERGPRAGGGQACPWRLRERAADALAALQDTDPHDQVPEAAASHLVTRSAVSPHPTVSWFTPRYPEPRGEVSV